MSAANALQPDLMGDLIGDLIGDMIAEVARTQGVAISRDDPILAAVLLNQVVLRRYLEKALGPAAAVIRDATRDAVSEVEAVAQAQAHWLEQVSLKDRASFLEDQKALHDAWKADMAALIEGQNAALQQVVMQTVALLRAQGPAAGAASPGPGAGQQATPAGPVSTWAWAWIWGGMLLGTGATLVLTIAMVVWMQVIGR